MPAARRNVPRPDPIHLGELILAAFGIRLTDLDPLERGEEGHKWVGRAGSARFLATVLAREDATALADPLEACGRIAGLGESWLIPPLVSGDGRRFAVWGDYGVLFRPFVEGACLDSLSPSAELARAVGRVIGRLHACSREIGLEMGVDDESTRSIRDEMAAVLDLAGQIDERDPRRDWARSLAAQRHRLEHLAETTDALRRAVERASPRWVITHGNATPSNLILGESGRMTLIDWSTMCFSPAERDLIHFVGPHFADFLAGYRESTSTELLDWEVFSYYLHRWWTDGVTYFGRRLFGQRAEPAADRRTWEVLSLFLPEPATLPEAQLRQLRHHFGWKESPEDPIRSSRVPGIDLWTRVADAPAKVPAARAREPRVARRGGGIERPLRVLHVAPYSERAWAYGGIPRVLGALARGLGHRGHEVTVATTDALSLEQRLSTTRLDRSRTAEFTPNDGGYDQRVFRNLSNRVAYSAQFFLPLGMRAFLDQNVTRFDVVHVHAFRNLPATLAALACRRSGVPFVATPNGTGPNIERRRLAKRIYDLLFQRVALNSAARLLAVTEAEIRDLTRMGLPRERLALLPNPLELEEFEPEVPAGRLRERLGIGDAPLVVYLGRISPRKRIDTLVRAFARLEDESTRLVIAGSDMGGMAAVQREIRTAALGERVHLPGLLVGRDRLEALRDADVVAYATESEIFGLVPFEALLVGSPVVVADDSGCGELVRRTLGGRLVRPGDVAELAAALREILASPAAWRDEANAAAVRVRAELGTDAVCARLEEIYRSVVARAPGAQPAAP